MDTLRKLIKALSVSLAVLCGMVLLGLSLPIAGWRTFSVQTGSMQPAIDPGDLVLVRRIAPENLRPGDVITFINPSNQKQTITHRLVRAETNVMGSRQLITKGDANDAADTPISPNAVVGKVTKVVPVLGKVSSFLRSPIGLVSLIYVPALIVIGSEFRHLAAYYRNQQHYRLAGYFRYRQSVSGRLGTAKYAWAVLLIPIAFAAPVLAVLHDSVTFGPNTITALPNEEPEPEPPTGNFECTITNTNNVNITSTSNQTATSGDASSNNNTTGGNVSSGDATATNSTSTNVNITNNNQCPPPETNTDTAQE